MNKKKLTEKLPPIHFFSVTLAYNKHVTFAKRAILALAFSFFSVSLFASPGGGPAPGGGGGAPSRSRPSPRSRPQPKKSGKSGESAKPSERQQGSAKSKSNSEEKKSTEQNQNQPKTSEKSAVQINADDILYYRGNRTLAEQGNFSVQNIKTERTAKNEVSVEIVFSQCVNPRSFSENSILVDGKAISEKTNFSFNKKGDTIKITIPTKNKNFDLTVQGVESFEGTEIEPIIIKNVSDESGGKQ